MIFALALLVGSLVVFFDMIQPAYSDLQTKKGTELSNQNFLVTEQQTVDQAKGLLTQFQTEGQAQDNLALAMPSGPNVAGALAQLYGIAQNNGITVQSVNVSPTTIQVQSQAAKAAAGTANIVKPLGTISFQISATGSYGSLKIFLSQIETNIRIFDLTTLNIQPIANAPVTAKGVPISSDLFTYGITVVTYYQLP